LALLTAQVHGATLGNRHRRFHCVPSPI
jgi:hypothetical protein